jgi:hypothetical protein
VFEARRLPGVKVALDPEQATVPMTAPPGLVRVKLDVVRVAQFTTSLKLAVRT